MSLEANRRRFLALASLALATASGTAARAQGSAGYSSEHPTPRREWAPEPVPEGIPADPAEQVVKDIGSWRVVSQLNFSQAFIPAERVKVSSGGVEGLTPGGKGFHAALPDVKIVGGNGESLGSTADKESPQEIDPSRRILIGGRGELKIQYSPIDRAFEGALQLATTSNGQGRLQATITIDGNVVRTETIDGSVDIRLADLFGADLAGLRLAKSVEVTAEVDGSRHVIYAVDLVDTDAALKQMQVVPDYNYNVRRLGRGTVEQEARDSQQPSSPGQCFLTTACCEVVGLADDCFELRSLRRFRDTVMLADESGRRDVRRYYEEAPRILAEIRRRGEEGKLRRLYFGTILPCAIAARFGLETLPRVVYSRMMRRLAARYLPGG